MATNDLLVEELGGLTESFPEESQQYHLKYQTK